MKLSDVQVVQLRMEALRLTNGNLEAAKAAMEWIAGDNEYLEDKSEQRSAIAVPRYMAGSAE